MRLSHINSTMPKGSEDRARSFYTGVLGLPEIPKPEADCARSTGILPVSIFLPSEKS